MNYIFSLFTSCGVHSYQEYEVLEKKDEDRGIEELRQWIETHPVNSSIKMLESAKKLDKYTNELMKSLKEVPLTNSNIDLLKDHLILLAKENDSVRRRLIDKISNLKGEKSLLEDLQVKLIFTCAH
ncbi:MULTISPECIES: hypothetical protein [unclassified Neochlamydia]|uniref:hypothetical protein n=1 Tax=unclassified Neochlamydia TaxID=2643326 RepID=UPI00140CC13F|nr:MULTISPECIES: hypothetical protein [unclassified Neochlamydia]MBS4166514.1 Uncharacterized protein [Neochlamydia sp. AcF65]MBS4169899.1 Uncharacterized protein [Neochlamydia sp. AcF95]NGY96030.1 hypothetical protein [Neochlamydia sp. AcF84]